jgi:hypothetical protein
LRVKLRSFGQQAITACHFVVITMFMQLQTGIKKPAEAGQFRKTTWRFPTY